MDNGWVKLWRKSINSGWLQNPKLWAFWCWCLMKASHKRTSVLIGFQRVSLEAGQFIFGRKAAAEELEMSERTVRTCLDSLRKLENVTIKSTNKFSIISVVNWDIYQGDDSTNSQQSDQQATSKRPASDQQATTNKNVKNAQEEKEHTHHTGARVITGTLPREATVNGAVAPVCVPAAQYVDWKVTKENPRNPTAYRKKLLDLAKKNALDMSDYEENYFGPAEEGNYFDG